LRIVNLASKKEKKKEKIKKMETGRGIPKLLAGEGTARGKKRILDARKAGNKKRGERENAGAKVRRGPPPPKDGNATTREVSNVPRDETKGREKRIVAKNRKESKKLPGSSKGGTEGENGATPEGTERVV